MRSLLVILLLSSPLAAQQSTTPATDTAVSSIRQQTEQLAGARPGLSREYVFAVATMNHVQSHLSSLNYSILVNAKKPVPKNVEECFERGAGICGNHVAAFLKIASRLEVRARPVEFYLHEATPQQNHGHICVEVFYREKWRLIDVTWGTVYRMPGGAIDELASVTEIRNDARSRTWAVTNETDLWYQQWKASGLDPLEYVDFEDIDILRGRAGTIRLVPQPADQGQRYQPVNQPGYLGRNDPGKDFGAIKVSLVGVNPAAGKLTIEILGVAGTGQLVISAQADRRVTIPFEQLQAGKSTSVDLPGLEAGEIVSLQVKPATAAGVGYVVYKQVTLSPR